MSSGVTGSIRYNLSGNADLMSFPFYQRTGGSSTTFKYTPKTLNEALGGGEGGTPLSSSLIGRILGQGQAAEFFPGVGFVGSLQHIDPNKAYWLRPYSGSGNFDSSAEIDGIIRSKNDPYPMAFGWNLTSNPLRRNTAFFDAINTGSSLSDPEALHNQGITGIIGESVAKTFTPGTGWIGSLDTFTTGSGYWFRNNGTAGVKNIWKATADSDVVIDHPSGLAADAFEEWSECTDQGPGSTNGITINYGTGCYFYRSATNGFHLTTEYPFSASGHTFGHKQSSKQYFLWFPENLGYGPDGSLTSSLLDSASNDMAGPKDGSSNFIVGVYAESGSATHPFPQCCGAITWHNHEATTFLNNSAPDNYVGLCVMGDDDFIYAEEQHYPAQGDNLTFKVYDPRRDLVVTASAHQVNLDAAGSASIGEKITLTWVTDAAIQIFSTGSHTLFPNGYGPSNATTIGGVCLKMDS